MPNWWSVGGEIEQGRFLGLSIVLFLAVAVPLLFSRMRRFRVPVVVGEILAGIVVGVSGLGWVPEGDPFLDLLAEIGLVILMFLAGLEIDVQALGLGRRQREVSSANADNAEDPEDASSPSGPGPLRLALEYFGLTLALTGAASTVLWKMGLVQDPIFIALILATISLGVVMPVLKEQGLLGGRYGQTILVSALVADFATMILITIQVAVLSKGLTFEILLVSILFVVLFGLYRLGLVVLPGMRSIIDDLSNATTQIHIRIAFLLLVTFVALSEVLGTEVILGAFLAGLLISMLTRGEEHLVKHQLESIGYGFFIPIFFIMVGVEFDLRVLSAAEGIWFLIPFLVVAAFVTKIAPAWVFTRAFPKQASFAGGVLLSAQLSLTVAAAEIGRQLGILSEAVVMSLILMAVVTVTVAPLIFTHLMRPYEKPERPIIIIGAGAVGVQMAQQLAGHGTQVVLLDDDEKRVAEARKMGLEVHLVSLSTPGVAPYLDGAHTVIVASSDPERTVEWAQLARRVFGVERVLALNANPGSRRLLQDMGVHCISPLEAQATFMALMARNPDLLHLLTSTQDNRDVLEITIRNPALDGKRLRDLNLPPHALVLAIHRGGEYLIPRGDTRVRIGDVLTILGTLEDLERVQARLGAPRTTI